MSLLGRGMPRRRGAGRTKWREARMERLPRYAAVASRAVQNLSLPSPFLRSNGEGLTETGDAEEGSGRRGEKGAHEGTRHGGGT